MAVNVAPLGDPEIKTLRAWLDVSREQFGRMVDVSAKTVERWEAKNLHRAAVTAGAVRLAQLAKIIELGLKVYTPDGMRLFMKMAMPEFGGRTPNQLVQAGEADRVIAALATDYEGGGF